MGGCGNGGTLLHTTYTYARLIVYLSQLRIEISHFLEL
jgi:hypothetical protein